MRKLTKPKVGMTVYFRRILSDGSMRCRIANVRCYNNSIFIKVIDLDTGREYGWLSLANFFSKYSIEVDQDNVNWLHEGF